MLIKKLYSYDGDAFIKLIMTQTWQDWLHFMTQPFQIGFGLIWKCLFITAI